MFEVKLKPGHPTGIYHRAGIEFTRSGPVYLEEVPEEVLADPWLIVTEADLEKIKAAKENTPAALADLEAELRQAKDGLRIVDDLNRGLHDKLEQAWQRSAELESQLSGANRKIKELEAKKHD